jgi:hypothetical protein
LDKERLKEKEASCDDRETFQRADAQAAESRDAYEAGFIILL